jgi:cyclophilin family peptidyl-prolyl cis-trans isomerase
MSLHHRSRFSFQQPRRSPMNVLRTCLPQPTPAPPPRAAASPLAGLAALFATTFLAACGGGGGGEAPAPAPPPFVPTACVATTPTANNLPQVTMTLSNGAGVNGTITIDLENVRAPATVANFLAYVNAGFYNGTVIHRHSPNFVLQGGGYAGPLVANSSPLPTLKPTNAAIALEDNQGLCNTRSTLAMARTSVPDSATSQFFINLANNAFLNRTATDRGYAVFGTITAGQAVIDAMVAAPCTAWPGFLGTGECLPSPNITVVSATRTR